MMMGVPFVDFVICSQNGDLIYKKDSAKFGYKQDMKVKIV
jgi:hypothetical protein